MTCVYVKIIKKLGTNPECFLSFSSIFSGRIHQLVPHIKCACLYGSRLHNYSQHRHTQQYIGTLDTQHINTNIIIIHNDNTPADTITQHTHSIHPCPTLQVIVNSLFLFDYPLIMNLVDQESKEIRSTGTFTCM